MEQLLDTGGLMGIHNLFCWQQMMVVPHVCSDPSNTIPTELIDDMLVSKPM